MTTSPVAPAAYGDIHAGIVELLETAHHTAARSVNALMTASYWEIGRRIVEFEQGGAERAGYGEVLVERLSVDLTKRFGRGFGKANLWSMKAFYLAWPADPILQTVSGESAQAPILQTLPAESVKPMRHCCPQPLNVFSPTQAEPAWPF